MFANFCVRKQLKIDEFGFREWLVLSWIVRVLWSSGDDNAY